MAAIVHIPSKNLGIMFCFVVADILHQHYLCRYCKFNITVLLLEHAPNGMVSKQVCYPETCMRYAWTLHAAAVRIYRKLI